jgi:hypothetical protein
MFGVGEESRGSGFAQTCCHCQAAGSGADDEDVGVHGDGAGGLSREGGRRYGSGLVCICGQTWLKVYLEHTGTAECSIDVMERQQCNRGRSSDNKPISL